MTDELIPNEHEDKKIQVKYQGGSSSPVYGLGMIGAWVYYLTHATSFLMGLLGIFKGIFWPAFLVFELMKYLGM